MKIAYISCKKKWGGVVSWMIQTALGLEKRGHEVWIISHPNSRLNKSIPANIKLISKRAGFDFNPISILWLIGFIKKHDIDIVVANIKKEVLWGGLAAFFTKIPLVQRLGNVNDMPIRPDIWKQLLVKSCLVPGNCVKREIEAKQSWWSPNKIKVIHNGRNTLKSDVNRNSAFRANWGVPTDAIIIGVTCQLVHGKHIDHLLDAFAKLPWQENPWFVVIAGEGPEKDNLQQQCSSLSIDERVKFIGFTSKPMDVSAAYDIAVFTSAFEGFPNTVVEYLAAGVPTVSSNINGVNEIIEHNHNGYLYPYGNIDCLATYLLDLLSDSDKRQVFSRAGQETIEGRFSETIVIAQLEEYFSELIS